MSENKYILLIVEGDLDYQFYGEYLSEIISSPSLNIKVTGGDILTKDGKGTPEKLILEAFNEELEKTKLKPTDFVQIIQICDTDGSYFSDDIFQVDGQREYYNEKTYEYSPYNNKVYVKSEEKKKKLLTCWNNKKANQETLVNTSLIKVSDKYAIPYNIYYVSLFLEHLLKDDVLIDSDEKRDCIDTFLDYHGVEEFIDLLKKKNIGSDYLSSWQLLESRDKKYDSCTNLKFLIDLLNSLSTSNT
ncbi:MULTISPECIES: hypothetical protein [Enterococcus]|uniref:Uncharacterized protein n=1 Tax=Enterococcus thailandicus TaxID=417368 RepID=A0A179EPE8_ENTTH|nr:MULTISPECIES: hypothetical protein [Enterococcus]MDT2987333.1 hypothetical protein [Enterococcus casseliflavus]MUN90939.1 hypothetical protein [Enterococcus gallinarum]OAQ55115.1 hypothetical protein A6E74_09620 [Enterococcus thailandicus]HAR1782159.1 hypothetical protein [Enterococcus faecium]